MKIKNLADYLFNGNLIANIKGFDSCPLKVYKLSFKGVFNLNIYYIKYIPTKSPNRVGIDRTDNDKDYLYLFLDDGDGYTEEKDGINLSFLLLQKKTKKHKKITKTFGKKLKNKLN